MSPRKRLRCICPCGYGFETLESEGNAIAMVQAHFNKFHMDMLPFGITTTEARALLTSINDTGKPRSSTRSLYPTDQTTAFSTENTTTREKINRKKSQIIIH